MPTAMQRTARRATSARSPADPATTQMRLGGRPGHLARGRVVRADPSMLPQLIRSGRLMKRCGWQAAAGFGQPTSPSPPPKKIIPQSAFGSPGDGAAAADAERGRGGVTASAPLRRRLRAVPMGWPLRGADFGRRIGASCACGPHGEAVAPAVGGARRASGLAGAQGHSVRGVLRRVVGCGGAGWARRSGCDEEQKEAPADNASGSRACARVGAPGSAAVLGARLQGKVQGE